MANDITDAEARLALRSIEERRRQVIAEIDMPRWYWWGLALGWIGLGFVTDLGHPWVTAAATLAFGAVHSGVASHVLSGRHRSPQLSVRADVAGPSVAAASCSAGPPSRSRWRCWPRPTAPATRSPPPASWSPSR
jgi:hypothetical protein